MHLHEFYDLDIDASWSRLLNSPLGERARINYTQDARRTYHNWTHVLRGYHHAAHTFDLAYDVNLDAAWLGHDWVYDDLAGKELRSIEALFAALQELEAIPNLNISIVRELIETSIVHRAVGDVRLLMLDLADLALPKQTERNYQLINQESQALYGISERQYAQASVAFMTEFHEMMRENQSCDPENAEFWQKVGEGVMQNIRSSNALLS